jgi:hypothetical protein
MNPLILPDARERDQLAVESRDRRLRHLNALHTVYAMTEKLSPKT